ncbi:MAG: hypothetical protein NTV02_02435 [Candidatus Zambryskibacteria bacterium]|nr:hypothetical protein [Candidatus Zambryskibacteria bacterium]
MNWDKKFTQWVGSKASVLAHTIFFIAMFSLYFFGIAFDTILLVLTTLVSLEAIYLAIFIQMTVNQNTESLEDVEEDIEEIKEDMDEIQEDVGAIEKDIDEIQEDVDEISEDIGEIQEDVDEIEKDTETMQKKSEDERTVDLESIQKMLQKLMDEVEKLKGK